MNFKHFFFISILSTVVFSQIDTAKIYYPNGTLSAVIPYYKAHPEGVAKYFFPNGVIKEEKTFIGGRVTGLVKVYNESGVLQETYTVENGLRNGPASYYDQQGNFVEEKFFERGKIKEEVPPAEFEDETTWAEDSVTNQAQSDLTNRTDTTKNEDIHSGKTIHKKYYQENDTAFVDLSLPDSLQDHGLDQVPVPIAGMELFYQKLSYPSIAKEQKIEGRVLIKTLINENGDVMSAEAISGPGFGCETASEIAVFYTRFKPGMYRGKPIKVLLIFPIDFKLQ